MVKLSSRVVKHLTGFAHIQTYPYYAYSKAKTIANAERKLTPSSLSLSPLFMVDVPKKKEQRNETNPFPRKLTNTTVGIVAIFKLVNPDFPSSRICIKIPSTYEGLSACRDLEARGIATLATTLFSMEQAALAADAGCTYIAPYVNELAVHFVAGHVDGDKGFALCRSAQRYYARIAAKTQVLPASLTSTAEVMRLAGVHHITVSPRLLAELAATPAVLASATVVDTPSTWFSEHHADDASPVDYSHVVRDEDAYRMAYTRSKGGENERKLASAINIFADMQDRMEELVRLRLG